MERIKTKTYINVYAHPSKQTRSEVVISMMLWWLLLFSMIYINVWITKHLSQIQEPIVNCWKRNLCIFFSTLGMFCWLLQWWWGWWWWWWINSPNQCKVLIATIFDKMRKSSNSNHSRECFDCRIVGTLIANDRII